MKLTNIDLDRNICISYDTRSSMREVLPTYIIDKDLYKNSRKYDYV